MQLEALRLCDAFDLVPLRAGDQADRSVFGDASAGPMPHPNTFQQAGLMKIAFGEIGKGSHSRVGIVSIDGCRRAQEALETVAGVFDRVYAQKAIEFRDSIYLNPAKALLVMRHFDATPMYLKYGAEAGALQNDGRYFVPCEYTDTDGVTLMRWKTVSLQEYKRLYPRRQCNAGVLDVMAQETKVVAASLDSGPTYSADLAKAAVASYRERSRDMILPPRIITRNNSSTTFQAVNLSDEAWTVKRIVSRTNIAGALTRQARRKGEDLLVTRFHLFRPRSPPWAWLWCH